MSARLPLNERLQLISSDIRSDSGQQILELKENPDQDNTPQNQLQPLASNQLDNDAEATRIRSIIIKKMSKTITPLVVVGFIVAGEGFYKISLIKELGPDAIAIDALNAMSFNLLLATDSGFLNPIGAMISQAYGKRKRFGVDEKVKQYIKVGRMVHQGWLLGGLLSFPVSAALWGVEPILELLQQNPEHTVVVGQYARLMSAACFPIYIMTVNTTFLRSISKGYYLVPIALLSSGMSCLVSYALIPGNFGFNPQNILGSAYATLIPAWIMSISLSAYLIYGPEFRVFQLRRFSCQNLQYFKQMLKLGLPVALAMFGEQFKYFWLGNMKGWLGTSQLAINQVSNRIYQFIAPPILAIRQGTQICVSQFNGIGDYHKMKLFGNIGVALEASIHIGPIAAYTFAPIPIFKYFLPDYDIGDSETFIRLVFITKALDQLLQSIQNSLSENIKGLLKTKFPSLVQLITSWAIILPLSALFAFVFEWDLIGMNAAVCIGSGIVASPLLAFKWGRISQGNQNEQRENQNSEEIDYIQPAPIQLTTRRRSESDLRMPLSNVANSEQNLQSNAIAPGIFPAYSSFASYRRNSSNPNNIDNINKKGSLKKSRSDSNLFQYSIKLRNDLNYDTSPELLSGARASSYLPLKAKD